MQTDRVGQARQWTPRVMQLPLRREIEATADSFLAIITTMTVHFTGFQSVMGAHSTEFGLL